MNKTTKALAALATLIALGCAGEDDSQDTSKTPATCDGVCARSIGCDNDPDPLCVAQCEMYESPCPDETHALLACWAGLPESSLVCGDDNRTGPKGTACNKQMEALAQCAAAQ